MGASITQERLIKRVCHRVFLDTLSGQTRHPSNTTPPNRDDDGNSGSRLIRGVPLRAHEVRRLIWPEWSSLSTEDIRGDTRCSRGFPSRKLLNPQERKGSS